MNKRHWAVAVGVGIFVAGSIWLYEEKANAAGIDVGLIMTEKFETVVFADGMLFRETEQRPEVLAARSALKEPFRILHGVLAEPPMAPLADLIKKSPNVSNITIGASNFQNPVAADGRSLKPSPALADTAVVIQLDNAVDLRALFKNVAQVPAATPQRWTMSFAFPGDPPTTRAVFFEQLDSQTIAMATTQGLLGELRTMRNALNGREPIKTGLLAKDVSNSFVWMYRNYSLRVRRPGISSVDQSEPFQITRDAKGLLLTLNSGRSVATVRYSVDTQEDVSRRFQDLGLSFQRVDAGTWEAQISTSTDEALQQFFVLQTMFGFSVVV